MEMGEWRDEGGKCRGSGKEQTEGMWGVGRGGGEGGVDRSSEGNMGCGESVREGSEEWTEE